MKKGLYILLGIAALFIMSFGIGYYNVFYTKTVGKAQQNAKREVYETSQSYVEGKRQEASKLYKEYLRAKDDESKEVIMNVVAHSFANFDESLLNDSELQLFIRKCKH